MNTKIQHQKALEATELYIRTHFQEEGSGHDWWHIYRVKNTALKIARIEGGNVFIIELAALLHDLDDWKLHNGDETSRTAGWLNELKITKTESQNILDIIQEVSFRGAGVKTPARTIEAKIVQDADRLDAIGAIGIARTFAYGGHTNRLIYDPAIPSEMHDNFEAYKNSSTPTINHFYEKLLLLKDRMNTTTARNIALERHRFMEKFLKQFYMEWESKM